MKEEAELEVEEKEEEVGDGEDEDALDSGINNATDPLPDCRIRAGLDFHREAYPKAAHHFIGIHQDHQDPNCSLDHNRIVRSTLAIRQTTIISTTIPLRFCLRQNQGSSRVAIFEPPAETLVLLIRLPVDPSRFDPRPFETIPFVEVVARFLATTILEAEAALLLHRTSFLRVRPLPRRIREEIQIRPFSEAQATTTRVQVGAVAWSGPFPPHPTRMRQTAIALDEPMNLVVDPLQLPSNSRCPRILSTLVRLVAIPFHNKHTSPRRYRSYNHHRNNFHKVPIGAILLTVALPIRRESLIPQVALPAVVGFDIRHLSDARHCHTVPHPLCREIVTVLPLQRIFLIHRLSKI